MAKKYISKYTGPEIDSGLDNIPVLEGKLTELEGTLSETISANKTETDTKLTELEGRVDDITGKKEIVIDLSSYNRFGGIMGDAGKYIGNSTNYKHIYIEVSAEDKFAIQGNANSETAVAFVSGTGVSLETISFCGEGLISIPKNGIVELDVIPTGAIYLCVNVFNAGADVSPSITKKGNEGKLGEIENAIMQNTESIKEVEKEIGEIESEIYNVSQRNSNTDYTTKSSARGAVPTEIRKRGTILTYLFNGSWIIEQFIGSDPSHGWQSLDEKWRQIVSFNDLIEINAQLYNVSQHNNNANYTTRIDARGAVPEANRQRGTIITYLFNGTWVMEQFIGSDVSYGWKTLDSQWKNIGENETDNKTVNLDLIWEPGYYGIESATGKIFQNIVSVKNGAFHTAFFDIAGAKTLNLSNIPSGFTIKTRFFDNAMALLTNFNSSTTTQTITIPDNSKYVCFDIKSSGADATIAIDDLQAIVISYIAPKTKNIVGTIKHPYIELMGNYFFSYRKVKGGNKNVDGTNVSTMEKAIDDYAIAEGLIALPKTYKHYGKPTKVIWFCNGSGNPGAKEGWGGYEAYVKYLLSEGYAVIDCSCWGVDSSADKAMWYYNFWATPTNIAITNTFYQYVMDNFNFEKDICVGSKSQGGVKAMYLVSSKIPVRAACLLASRVSPLCAIYGYSDKERAVSLNDMGFNILQDAEGNIIGDAQCMSHSYFTDNFEDADRRAYWENHLELVIGTDPLFKCDVGSSYIDTYRAVSRNDLQAYLAQNPKIIQDVPMMFIGAEDDVIYRESLLAFNAMQNQTSFAKRINMPNNNPTPHHAVDTTGVMVSVTTRYGEVIDGVPLAWVEMLAFFDNFS